MCFETMLLKLLMASIKHQGNKKIPIKMKYNRERKSMYSEFLVESLIMFKIVISPIYIFVILTSGSLAQRNNEFLRRYVCG